MIETFATSNYPKCDGIFWDKPVKESCPTCSMPFILEKTTNRDGTVRYCQNEGCDYKMAIETNDEASGDRAEATSGVIALSNERESSIPQGIFEKPR